MTKDKARENKRTGDRRVSKFDFRKNKVNNRKGYRRRVDKINHSIYYIILFAMFFIIVAWGAVDVFFLMEGK